VNAYYFKKELATVLNLDAAPRKSFNERFLRDNLVSWDVMQLNRTAYDISDRFSPNTLRNKLMTLDIKISGV